MANLTTFQKILMSTLGSLGINFILAAFLLFNMNRISMDRGNLRNVICVLLGFAAIIAVFIFIIKLLAWWTILYCVVAIIVWLLGFVMFAVSK